MSRLGSNNITNGRRIRIGAGTVLALWLCVPAVCTAQTVLNIASGSITIAANGDYVITGATTVNRIVVDNDLVVNITLRNLTIDLGGGGGCPLLIRGGATVHLTLDGNNILYGGEMWPLPDVGWPGIYVPDTATLHVTAQSTGRLAATGGGRGSAGIGQDGFYSEPSGTIIISGGMVIATGKDFGAGIGAGFDGTSGPITINGGTVTASSTRTGAGIGGDRGNVTINGGLVTASSQGGAGIGASFDHVCGPVTINGGTVTATGDAGIGGGSVAGGPIVISGGTVTTKGGGAGIGGGFGLPSGPITISGGTVTAEGSLGPAIGPGSRTGACGPVTISGGRVTATGGIDGDGFLAAIVGSTISIAPGVTIVAGARAGAARVKSAYRGEHYARLGHPVLVATPSRREVGPAGGRATFAVNKRGEGAMAYAATEKLAWLSFVGTPRGLNRGSVVVSCKPNPAAGARTGAITIRALGAGGSPRTVRVVQGGRIIPLLSVTPEIRTVGATAGRTTFAVANKGGGTMSYKAARSGGSWLKIKSGAAGGNSGKITVSWDRNKTANARTGTVVVAASGANGSPRRVTIVQAGRAAASAR